jgi:fido (protein-threonine AMPylation protein)
MSKKKNRRREGFAEGALYREITEKKQLETRNGLVQFDEVVKLIETSDGKLNLTVDIVKRLHFCAIQDIYRCAGTFRSLGER